jgi:hypothetical protein
MKTYVLVDRSASMMAGWSKTVAAMGEFLAGLKEKSKVNVTLFDSNHSGKLDYLCLLDGKRKKWNPELMALHPPRGMTPLWDAVATLASRIATDAPKKAQIVIITDGHENCSKECSNLMVRKIVKGWKKRKYDVIYIGASFADADVAAVAMGIDSAQTVNMASSAAYGETMSMMSTRNAAYATGEVKTDDDLGDKIRGAAGGKGK